MGAAPSLDGAWCAAVLDRLAVAEAEGGAGVVVVDLGPGPSALAEALGADPSGEGLSDVLLFGASLRHAPQPLPGRGYRYLPLGVAPEPIALLEPGLWDRPLAEAARRGLRLLAFAPRLDGVEALASRAAGVILLGVGEPPARLWGIPVLGSVAPPAPPAPEPTVEPVVEPATGALADEPVEAAPGAGASASAPPAEAAGPAGVEPVQEAIGAAEAAAHPARESATEAQAEVPSTEVDADDSSLLAPRARGLTIAEWLASEEARLRQGTVVRPGAQPGLRPQTGGGVTPLAPAPRPAGRNGGAPAPAAPPRAEPPPAEAAGPDPSAAAPPAAEAPAAEPELLPTVEPEAASMPEAEEPEPEAPAAAVRLPEPRDAPSKYAVPRTSPGRERLIHVVAVVILAYWTYYIGWRWTETLNWDAVWFSVPLALAETWGLISAYFLVFTTWRLKHRTPVPPPPGLAVDVFITTYDEPLELIRRTAISAREIRYPHRTYVLDDGRRDEIRAMTEELGIGYIRRDNNEHAKAGNLNNALKHTSGDFILQLDADHAPLPHILDRMLGFFGDSRVAFVQSPQDFYNTDSFTSDVNEAERRIWEEQRLFFSVIQPGKDNWNSAFFCGSCAVIRRAALKEIGGFSTHSITEDIETSMLLHSRGWGSVYYGESLAYGLAAGSAEAFHTQHMRWAQGAMQVIRKFNPLTYPGLTLAQRVGYFYSLTAYVVGLQKLIFFSAPLIFFLTGVLPIRALDREFLTRFVPYLIGAVVLIELLSRGLGFTWIAERYQAAKFWTYTRALAVFFTNRRLRFKVTPKGAGHVPVNTYLPQLVLMVITVVSVYWATLAHTFGWIDYDVPGWRSLAFQLNFFWASINFMLAAYVVRLSLRLHQQRQDHRFADRFPIHLRPRGPKGRLGERQIALTEDLNSGGLAFRSVSVFEAGTELKMTLPLTTGEVTVNGVVVHTRPDAEADVPIFVHGVEFRDVPLDVRDAIELHCTHHAVPNEQMRYHSSMNVLGRAHDWMRNARGEPRRRVRLPTWVLIGGEHSPGEARENVAFLEEISPGGARLIMDRPVAPGTHIVFEVPGTELRGEGLAVFSRALETPIGVRFAVGMRRESESQYDRPSRRKMRIPRLWRATAAATALAGLLGFTPGAATAQVQTAVFGSAEADTKDLSLFLLGVSVQPSGLGLQPTAGVLAYRLTFPVGTATTTLTAVSPSAGLRYQWPVGAVQATAGYLFLSDDTDGGFGAPGGSEEGLTTGAMADYWGTGAQSGQLLATYNWADQYFWGRAKGAVRVLSALAVGAEAVLQGGGDQPGGTYQAFQAGPLVEVSLTPSFRVTGVVGAKTDNILGNPSAYPYFKAEFVLVP